MTTCGYRAAAIAGLAAALAVVSLTAARAPRQDQRPIPSSPTFRSGVNLVTVDVVVRDKRTGRLVPDLTKDDFHIEDDGQPQTVTSFAAINLPDGRTAAGDEAPQYAGNDMADADEQANGRLVAFFVNDQSIGIEATSYVRDWLHRYVDGHMADDDQVAIWTVTGKEPDRLTSDRARLDRTIDRITGGADTLPYHLPPRFTLTMLAQLVDQLETISHRRKVVIYFGNLPLTERATRGHVLVDGLYEHLVQQAAAANVAIYPVHVTGVGDLDDLVGGMSAARGRMASPKGFSTPLPMSLQFLAKETGGVYYDRNDFDHVLNRIEQDAGHYYLLGFSPATIDPKPGDFRRLRVTVDRPDTIVQARSGYIQVPSAATP